MHRAWWIIFTAWTASPLRRLAVAGPAASPASGAEPRPVAKASFGPVSPKAHLAKEVKRKPALLQKAATAANHRQPAVYVPKIGIANVTTPTSFPPPPPVLNPVQDYQPLDTALGDLIQKQFIQPPTLTPPPTQEMLNVIYACPLLALDTSFIVRASNGCSDKGRAGIWMDSLKNTLLKWNEKPEAIADMDLTYSMPNGDGFGFTQGEVSLSMSQVDFMDCGLNVKYYMREYVYHVPGKPPGDDYCAKLPAGTTCPAGTIYLKYEIWQQGGTMVAVSSMVELFADEFTLTDPSAGVQLVKYARNAEWSPQDGCQTYNKEWIVTVGGGHLSDAPVRWVLGMFITALSIRDEERNVEGIIRATNTQLWTWGLIIGGSLLAIAFVAAMLYIFMTWEFSGQTGHELLTLLCLRFEDRIFPVTMYKNKSYT
jgi:hypothetical protein